MVCWNGKVYYSAGSFFFFFFFSFFSLVCFLSFTKSDRLAEIIIIIIILLLRSFSQQRSLKVFHWSLWDIKSPQVSRTLLSILADLNNAVVWTVSICPSISNPSCPFSQPLGTVPSEPSIIDINVTPTLQLFFLLWQRLSTCLSFRFLLFPFYCYLGRQSPL